MRLNDFQITPNFNLREFQCPCCHAVVLHRRLAVTSGYRCAPHNAAVGGAANSFHRRGLAADVAVPAGSQSLFREMAKEAGFARTIAYPERSFVHLEVSDE